MMAYRADTDFAYAMLRDGRDYKFGHSRHPVGRLIELQRTHRCDFELVSFYKGGVRAERYIHLLAESAALGREFFKKNPLTDYLAKNLPVIIQCAPNAIMFRRNTTPLSATQMRMVLDDCGINPIPTHLAPVQQQEEAA